MHGGAVVGGEHDKGDLWRQHLAFSDAMQYLDSAHPLAEVDVQEAEVDRKAGANQLRKQ